MKRCVTRVNRSSDSQVTVRLATMSWCLGCKGTGCKASVVWKLGVLYYVKSLMAPERSAGARLWFCESKGSVVQGSRVQRRVQSSNWTEDERELGLSRNR